MNSGKRLAGWLSATLLGAFAIAGAPCLFGGGGDEGVDILPFDGGDPTPPPGSPGDSFDVGCVRVEHVPGLTIDGNADWRHSGVLVGSDALGDPGSSFGGSVGDSSAPAAEVVAKGKKHLSFGEIARRIHVDGRFDIRDLDAFDRRSITLVGHVNVPALAVLIVGVRGTHTGSIAQSFSRIDQVRLLPIGNGMVSLGELRRQAREHLHGSGLDVAIGLLVPQPARAIQAWAAFNVDDMLEVHDVETSGR